MCQDCQKSLSMPQLQFKLCLDFGFKQLTEVRPITDQRLASFHSQGLLMWDYLITKFIHFTRIISRMKRSTHKQLRCHSLKNYSTNKYGKALVKLHILNYQILRIWIVLSHYIKFIQKTIWVIDLETSIKSRWRKPNSQKWFDDEVAEKSALEKVI